MTAPPRASLETDLWRRILSAPGDISQKARYVAVLVEAHDPRAEMFRLADELDALIFGYFERQATLTRQYETILATWRPPFDAAAATWCAELKFVKGWPSEITIAASDFVVHAAAVVATVPLRHLNLTAVSEAPGVFALEQLGQVASLDGSHQHWPDEAMAALGASRHLGSLQWLDLRSTGITDTGVELLAASPHLRHLAHLDLRDNPCCDPVDAAAGHGVDGISGYIVPESIYLPDFGRELEERYGRIEWLHALDRFMERHPPSRYQF